MPAAEKPDLIVVGGANTEFLLEEGTPSGAGEGIPRERFEEAAGGRGVNQAIAAARLGARVALVARVGSDLRGEMVLRRLAEEGVITERVTRDPEAPTGVVLVLVDVKRRRQAAAMSGANSRLTNEDVRDAAELFSSAKAVIVHLEVPVPAVKMSLELGRAARAKTILDPDPAEPVDQDFLRLTDVVRPGLAQASALTGVRARGVRGARNAGIELVARGAGAALIDAGIAGNVLVSEGRTRHFPPLGSLEAADEIGGGDAFFAGLAVRLAEGAALDEAVEFARACAAIGAQARLPTRGEVESMLQAPQPSA